MGGLLITRPVHPATLPARRETSASFPADRHQKHDGRVPIDQWRYEEPLRRGWTAPRTTAGHRPMHMLARAALAQTCTTAGLIEMSRCDHSAQDQRNIIAASVIPNDAIAHVAIDGPGFWRRVHARACRCVLPALQTVSLWPPEPPSYRLLQSGGAARP